MIALIESLFQIEFVITALVGFAELQERERRYTTPQSPEPRARAV